MSVNTLMCHDFVPDTPKNLDSNIKKNTTFIKKCKTSLGTDMRTQLLNDINKLSLEKYISEIVGSVMEGLLKCKTSVDIAAGVEVCVFVCDGQQDMSLIQFFVLR